VWLTISLLVVILVLAHLLCIGIYDVFVNVDRERRALALTHAFQLGVMAVCCLGLLAIVPFLCHHLNHSYFPRFFGVS
jgi:UDP-N-acetylmuramyl pentapeptide phosphotransferase/UDP-N-acetylglucosamine-1-phosphate transferase